MQPCLPQRCTCQGPQQLLEHILQQLTGSMPAGAVGKALPFGPQTAEHCILGADLLPSRKPAAQPLEEAEIRALFGKIEAWEAWLRGCEISVPQGYIHSKGAGGLIYWA